MMIRFTLILLALCSTTNYFCDGLSIPSVLKRFVPSKFMKSSSSNNNNHFHSVLLTRRTINSFEPTLPDGWETVMETAVHAATYAPNHKRTEPWRFHLLGPQAIQRVCELNAKLVTEKKGSAAGEKKLERWLQMPGWLVVTQVVVVDDDENANDNFMIPTSIVKEDYAACCCAIQNLCLSLHSQGYGTKWTTGPVNFDPEFAKAVGTLPSNEQVVGTIWFGIPSGTLPVAPNKKKSLTEVLCRHD